MPDHGPSAGEFASRLGRPDGLASSETSSDAVFARARSPEAVVGPADDEAPARELLGAGEEPAVAPRSAIVTKWWQN